MTSKEALTLKYQEYAVRMGRYMQEAAEHIKANAELDLTEIELVDAIEAIQLMLGEAHYNAERMLAYRRLIDGKAPPRCNCVKIFNPLSLGRRHGPHHYDTCPLYLAEAEVADR